MAAKLENDKILTVIRGSSGRSWPLNVPILKKLVKKLPFSLRQPKESYCSFGHQTGELASNSTPLTWLLSNTKTSRTKPPFSPLLWVRTPFSHPRNPHPPFLLLILLSSLPLPSTYLLSSPAVPLFPPSNLSSLLTPLLLPPGPAGLCGANHQTAAPLSPLTEQLPPPQQYTTPLGQSPALVATIQDPHLANRGGGLGQGGPSGLMEGTRRVNYWGATAAH